VSIDDVDAILAGADVDIMDDTIEEGEGLAETDNKLEENTPIDEIDAILAGIDVDIMNDSIEEESEGIDLSDTDNDEDDNLKKN